MTKTLFFWMALALAVGLFPACDGGEGSATGLAATTPGVTSSGAAFVSVGTISPTNVLPPTGTCEIPTEAESWVTVSKPMQYAVLSSNVLFCTAGTSTAGAASNIDFEQAPLKGITCLDLVSDVAAVKTALAGSVPFKDSNWGCCSLVEPYIGTNNGQQVATGYFMDDGIMCVPEHDLQVTAACSISGTFMGWACSKGMSTQNAYLILPLKK